MKPASGLLALTFHLAIVSSISFGGFPTRSCENTIATNHWEIYCRCAHLGIAKTSDTPS